jgi:hypothetical protein
MHARLPCSPFSFHFDDCRATTSGTTQVVAASASPLPHILNPSYVGHERPGTVKCTFKDTPVMVGEHIDSFRFRGGDVELKNIRITSYGYTCSVHLEVNAVQNPLPNEFHLINVNDLNHGGREAIDAFCRKALEIGTGIAIDTEGNKTIVDTIQIATRIAGDIGEVLVVQVGSGLEGVWISSFVQLLTQIRFPVYCDGVGATGGDDCGKVSNFLYLAYGLPKDSCTGVDALSGSACTGIQSLAKLLGFPFDMKRTDDQCFERGYGIIKNRGDAKVMRVWEYKLKKAKEKECIPSGKEKKNALYQDSSHALFPTRHESLVDISREVHKFLRITVTDFSFENRPLLTLEQATYAALDAWITLWGGIFYGARH